MDKFTEQLDTLIYDSIISGEESNEEVVEKILELLTPKLDWKHLYEYVWIGKTPFDYTFTLHLEGDGLWKIHKLKFQGTLDECKKECERLFMEMYLTTCE